MSKQQAHADRGNKHFWEKVDAQVVGLRATVNGIAVGAGYSAGGRHAEDELINELHQLAWDSTQYRLFGRVLRSPQTGQVLVSGNNNLVISKLDATPCTEGGPCGMVRAAGRARVRSRVDVFEAIRRDRSREELSIRGLAGRHHVHRRTVRAALDPRRHRRVGSGSLRRRSWTRSSR